MLIWTGTEVAAAGGTATGGVMQLASETRQNHRMRDAIVRYAMVYTIAGKDTPREDWMHHVSKIGYTMVMIVRARETCLARQASPWYALRNRISHGSGDRIILGYASKTTATIRL